MNRSRGRRTRKNGCELPANPGAGPGRIDLPMLPVYGSLDLCAGARPVPVGVPGPSSPCQTGHEWVVYSTALLEGWLMLQCVECHAMGTIDDPSKHEWSGAFHAPSRPYRWRDATRVTVRGYASPRVIRAIDGPRCDCPSQRTLPANRGYERVPGGIWEHPGGLSDAEKAELLEVAEFVEGSDLCSSLLPLFNRCYEEDTGFRHSQATHTIVGRIERWGLKGIHCSPAVMARIIREFATWEPDVGSPG